MQKEYQEPFIPGIKYELADILATHYAKSKLNRNVNSQDKIYQEHFELLTGLSTGDLYETYLELNKELKISEDERVNNNSVQTLKNYFKELADICGRCFPTEPNHTMELHRKIKCELERLSHISKALYESYKEEYECFKQHPFLKIKDEEEEFILTP